jgi:hypothetical protein
MLIIMHNACYYAQFTVNTLGRDEKAKPFTSGNGVELLPETSAQ